MCANQPLEREIVRHVGCHTQIIESKYHGNMSIPSGSKNDMFANKPNEKASGPYVCCNNKTRFLEALMTIHALNGIVVAHQNIGKRRCSTFLLQHTKHHYPKAKKHECHKVR